LQIVVFRLRGYVLLSILARIFTPEADYLIIEGNKMWGIYKIQKRASFYTDSLLQEEKK